MFRISRSALREADPVNRRVYSQQKPTTSIEQMLATERRREWAGSGPSAPREWIAKSCRSAFVPIQRFATFEAKQSVLTIFRCA